MLSLLFRKTATNVVARRSIQTSVVKRSSDPLIGHVDQAGQPGANLPFGIGNKLKLTALFIFYFGSAFSAPYLIVRYQLLKNKS